MTQTFAASARQLAGLAGRRLGWPPHWFWRATPDELATILVPPESSGEGLSRADLDRLMEHDRHG
jgi:hypothetical protein